MTKAWDVIPDIHADRARLHASLGAVEDGARIAFLGDLIDGGSNGGPHDDREVLTRARALVEAGRAVAILGNHEVNAILFHRTGTDGAFLREGGDRAKQHRSFLDAFGHATPEALDWTDWFLTLPLWRDLGGLRLVHAYWSDADIALVAARRPDGRLRPEDLPEVAAKATPFARAVERLTCGPETELPEGRTFHDIHRKERSSVRIAWWREPGATWREAALSVPEPGELPGTTVPECEEIRFYPADAPPVLVGHYKMRGRPEIETGRAASLDYPDTPVIYRWRGETQLEKASLHRLAA